LVIYFILSFLELSSSSQNSSGFSLWRSHIVAPVSGSVRLRLSLTGSRGQLNSLRQ